ncbi:MAG: hypothetical protein GF308_04340 [Candidatus Heimdallarchaeota archaeon]|nr:hypothetical protein [Candidatus Heimdallarchaeota archaeon]
MPDLINALEKIGEGYINRKGTDAGAILGIERLKRSSQGIKKCVIAPRLTRRVVVRAVQEKAELIITIIPPSLTRKNSQKIETANFELLQILIKNNIGIYSIGLDWFSGERGGFDFLLKLIDFAYTSPLPLEIFGEKQKLIIGRLGEKEVPISLKELLGLLDQFVEQKLQFIGYIDKPIQKVAVFLEIVDEEAIYEITRNNNIDAVIFGEISYEALVVAHLNKLTFCVVGQRELENILLIGIQRRLQEELPLSLPELIMFKQEKIVHHFTT